jgi:nifR3 family TIM-barrel protein
MGDLDLAREIIRAVRSAVRIPLTVKFRLGLRDDRRNFLDLARICEAEGVDGVALHARTAKQMFSGRSDWTRIAELKAAVSIPVVGNGDVVAASDAVRMLRETGCDGVMIGRASMKNPWIYRQAAELLAGRAPYEPTVDDRRAVILEHFRMLREQEDDAGFIVHKMKTFTGWYTHGLPAGKHLRSRIGALDSAEAFLEAVETFFASVEREAA